MIRKTGNRFSEKIVPQRNIRFNLKRLRSSAGRPIIQRFQQRRGIRIFQRLASARDGR